MTSKHPKAVKIILFIIAFCIVCGFAANWYLTYRLQSKLNEKLTEEVLKATDGFYRCTFEKLSVGLFNGELSIKEVKFEPDSLAFIQWQKGDTLPNVYYKAHIGEIHFRGVNLTWLWSYSELHFSLFELNSPDVRIIQPKSSREPTNSSGRELKDLYQVVSPYIEELTVNRINLKDANVSYIIEDTISPVIYALREANFTAYKFRLDKHSSASGKLLYSDHFEFKADKPQQLLYSDQVILETDNIKLSTIDSQIKIEGVKIRPKDTYWNDSIYRPGGYLKAEIASVIAEGVGFNRENARNYLHASSFNIESTDIKYYSLGDNDKLNEDNAQQPDTTTDQTWSLYNLISPILSSISIDKVGIEKTKFNYTLMQNGNTDIYTLYEFDFHANKFSIDSLSEQKKKFWYVDNFMLTGSNINGLMESNNSNVSATSLYLSTSEKKFHIDNITLQPLSVNSGKDYMSGGIKRIGIDGLEYNTGVSAEELKIDTLNIEYVRVSAKNPTLSISKSSESPEDIFEMFNPYADYLSVKRIDLKDASMTVRDKGEGQVYRLKHINFYATRFLIDEQTRRSSRYLFTCDDIGLKIKNFDNLLPGGNYRLQVANTDISTLAGRMRFEDVRLTPQTGSWKKAPATYYDIRIPLFDIEGFDNEAYMNKMVAKIKSFKIASPDISIVKLYNSNNKDGADNSDHPILSELKNLSVGNFSISDAKIRTLDHVSKDSTLIKLQSLQLSSFDWSIRQKVSVREVIVESPDVDLISNGLSKESEKSPTGKNMMLSLFGDNINIGKFSVYEPSLSMQRPDSKLRVRTDMLSLSGLSWSDKDLKLTSFDLIKPNIRFVEDYKIKTDTIESKETSSTDLYAVLGESFNNIAVARIHIEGAGIDYSHTLNGKAIRHQEVSTMNLKMDNLKIDPQIRSFDIADFIFNAKDLHLPIMDGFYTLDFDKIDLNKKLAYAEISGIKMTSTYPKMEFSYIHPKHKDWFDVSVGDVVFSGLDYARLFKENVLKAKDLEVNNIVLQNLKNKQIYTPPKMQPMIYTKIQELPIGLDIDTANLKNFSVIYDELPKDSEEMGRILFENMNGRFSKLTNIASYPNEYMHVDIDGQFMESGLFTARWDIPVSADYDCFVLRAHLKDFDLRALNPIFIPLAKAEMKTGYVNEFRFKTEATSMDAYANMLLLYTNLEVNLLKDPETQEKKKFLSSLTNMVIKSNNPDKKGGLPRVGDVNIVRDPYHSSFNYFWQIMQPAVVESVGVSQSKQNFMKKATSFFTKVKNFFTGKKKEEKPKELTE